MIRLLEKWGSTVYRLRWAIIVFWILIIGASGAVAGKLPTLLSGGGWAADGSTSKQAFDQTVTGFAGRSGASVILVMQDPKHEVGTSEYQSNMQAMLDVVKSDEKMTVESVYTWKDAPEEAKKSLTGNDKHTSIAFVGFNVDEDYARNTAPDLQKKLVAEAEKKGVEAYIVGTSPFWGEINILSQEGLAKAEMITGPLIMLILLFVFRTLVASFTPMIIGTAAVLTSFGILTPIAEHYELSIFVTNSASMLGLAVGIDYSLFMVNRFREELKRHGNVQRAISTMMGTAGEAVIFSGITIVVSMAALFIVKLNAIQSIALGSVIVVFVAILAAVTLLPAVLSVLGPRVNKGRIPFLSGKAEGSDFWYRFTHKVMRRPIVFLLIGFVILGAMAWPSSQMTTFTPDAQILPDDSPTRMGYELIKKQYGPGYTSPIQVVVHSDSDKLTKEQHLEAINKMTEEIKKADNVESVASVTTILEKMDAKTQSTVLDDKDRKLLPTEAWSLLDRYMSKNQQTAIIEVIPVDFAASDKTTALMEKIRDHVIKDVNMGTLSVSVGGETSEGIDSNKLITDGIPWVLLIMLTTGYVILLITFRSILLPLKAIVLNLVSVAAVYGVLTLVFQLGYDFGLVGSSTREYVMNFVPILLLTLLFSLSTDYEVFLLSRVREEYMRTGNSTESVAVGVSATAPMISGAALLMVGVFASFAFASILPIQQLGFGMAIAIALDATLVRLVLVPAAMKLLGHASWFPGSKSRKKHARTGDSIATDHN